MRVRTKNQGLIKKNEQGGKGSIEKKISEIDFIFFRAKRGSGFVLQKYWYLIQTFPIKSNELLKWSMWGPPPILPKGNPPLQKKRGGAGPPLWLKIF